MQPWPTRTRLSGPVSLRQAIAERQAPETRCMRGTIVCHTSPCRRRQFTRASILFDSWGCIRLLNQVEFASNSHHASGCVMSPCRSAMACLQACLPAPSAVTDLPRVRCSLGLGLAHGRLDHPIQYRAVFPSIHIDRPGQSDALCVAAEVKTKQNAHASCLSC